MTRNAKIAIGAFVLLTPAFLYYYNATACACLTPDRAAHGIVKTEIRHVLAFQDMFRDSASRYAHTLDELMYLPKQDVRLVLQGVTDSSFSVEATALPWPQVSCHISIASGVVGPDSIQCTGRAPGPLGW